MSEKKEKKEKQSNEEIVTTPRHGVYVFPNGDRYDGEYSQLLNGSIIRNGYGEHSSSDGLICKCLWENDKMNGKGMVIHPSGAVYEGDIVNNMMHGYGKYVFTDKSVYEGEFFENRLDGGGTLTDCNGQNWCGKFNNKTANSLEFKLKM